VAQGSVKGVLRTLEAGACVNGYENNSIPPIIGSASLGHVDIIKLLLSRGADPEAAVRNKHGCCAHLEGARAVHAAAHGRRAEALKTLLQAGADPNSVDSQGISPLMAVCREGVPAAALGSMPQALLNAGGDLLLRNKCCGCFAIHYAARSSVTPR
ncbi:unnamed protein product, partial [Scytosiphon promiscuus]